VRIKSNPATRHIPIIFTTAKDELEDELRGLELGAADYITKPFQLPIVLARVRTHIELKLKTDALEQQGSNDGLTGIANRRAFDRKLDVEWRRTCRSETALSLIMCDIDYFKRYNDHFGHLQGDTCLIQVAQMIAAQLHRPADLAARFGGEEFAVLLPEDAQRGREPYRRPHQGRFGGPSHSASRLRCGAARHAQHRRGNRDARPATQPRAAVADRRQAALSRQRMRTQSHRKLRSRPPIVRRRRKLARSRRGPLLAGQFCQLANNCQSCQDRLIHIFQL
jgi:GGDEF domain-containing protein